jgi:hypothetical protein
MYFTEVNYNEALGSVSNCSLLIIRFGTVMYLICDLMFTER